MTQENSPQSPPSWLSGLGLAIAAGAVTGAWWHGPRAMAAALVAALGGYIAGFYLGRRREAHAAAEQLVNEVEAAQSRTLEFAREKVRAREQAAASPLLHPTDKQRLMEWTAEPIALLEEADREQRVTGFNRARSCAGMGQVSAWRRSMGAQHPDADALLGAIEEAIQHALIEVAEYFSPVLESVGKKGGTTIDGDASRQRIFEIRKQTLGVLSELRARLSNLPVTTQESFDF